MITPTCLTPTPQPHVNVSVLSHKGLVRDNNEDHLLISSFQCNQGLRQPVLLAALSDGVGGHHGGEVAAQVGIETIGAVVSACASLDDPPLLLRDAILAANQAVLERASAEKTISGMGATCVCALLVGPQLYIANLGDSRVYLADEGNLTQLTCDHTWLEENSSLNSPSMRSLGRRRHPFAHVLSRYLGSSHPPQVDLRLRLSEEESDPAALANQGLTLLPNQQVLLCSDGLSDMLADEDIHAILRAYPPRKAAQKLVLCALEAGGHDNVSAIVIELPQTHAA